MAQEVDWEAPLVRLVHRWKLRSAETSSVTASGDVGRRRFRSRMRWCVAINDVPTQDLQSAASGLRPTVEALCD